MCFSPQPATPSLCTLPPTVLFLWSQVCTVNAFGIFAKDFVTDTSRHLDIVRFFHRNRLYVMGKQEPYRQTLDDCAIAKQCFHDKGINFLSNAHYGDTPRAWGAVALLYHKDWSVVTLWSTHPRILYASIADPDGNVHNFLITHFHHQADIRLQQWGQLKSLPTSWIHDPCSLLASDLQLRHSAPGQLTTAGAPPPPVQIGTVIFLTNLTGRNGLLLSSSALFPIHTILTLASGAKSGRHGGAAVSRET